jgi:C1A family cysteine protease
MSENAVVEATTEATEIVTDVGHIRSELVRHIKLNHKKDPHDSRDRKFQSFMLAQHLPASVDLSYKMPGVLDQGELGSCTAHSTTYNIHYMADHHSKLNKLPPVFGSRPSRLFQYANSRILDGTPLNDDAGSSLRTAFQAVAEYGACDETDWDYQPSHYYIKPSQKAYGDAKKHKHFQYKSVPQTELALKQALANGYPISFGISVYDSFMSDNTMRTGIVPMPNTNTEQLQGFHAIILCGFNDAEHMFTFENSWGTSVGLPNKPGFFKIPYKYVLDPNLASDFWICELFY